MEEICDAAGVAKGTFYFHFTTKDDLLVAALHRGGERWLSFAEELVSGDRTFEEMVVALGDRVAHATGAHPKPLVRRATLAAIAAVDPNVVPEGAQSRRAAVELLVAEGIRRGEVVDGFRTGELVMAITWSMLQATIVWTALDGDRPSLTTITRRRLRLALGGISAPNRARRS